MYFLLVAADHVLVVVVDVLGGGAGAPAGGHDVPAELCAGPRSPVAGVGPAAQHEVGVARLCPALPQLTGPGQAPGPAGPVVEVALYHLVGVAVHHIVIPRRDGLQPVAGRVERPAGCVRILLLKQLETFL